MSALWFFAGAASALLIVAVLALIILRFPNEMTNVAQELRRILASEKSSADPTGGT